MIDKLTKKRIKVDYLLLVKVAGLEDEFFFKYVPNKKRISLNRLALSFLRGKKIDIEYFYSYCLDNDLHTCEDYLKHVCKIAQTPWLDED